MERRRLVGFVMMAGMVVGAAGVGCRTTAERKDNPYISELGKEGTIGDTPWEVQEFVKSAYPDAEVEKVYEKRHRVDYKMRHFDIHLLLPGGRKKVIEYNVFVKRTPNAQQLDSFEVQGSGESEKANAPGSQRP